ncbi:MAG TPA: hypothetical protein ENN90_00260 [Mariniphaga anaerophila]|uniref:FAS1 domain-containing protein n=1 Tax=Mariniphaga anaerophila TaxID=1484053 RepID=A0A831LT02_9BACT|nr:hypothetical protein [Mariniphaga anaerophila]
MFFEIQTYMIRKNWIALLVVTITTLLIGCREEQDKFVRPEWLAGKVYTQILEIPELSTFTRCIELTGYDEILDISGSYTVFAPSNEAFNTFFANNPNYNSVDDISLTELNRLVKYHIVQNPWTKKQLRRLDIYGWIDTLDLGNNLPRGFKRETLLLEDNQKYGVKWRPGSGATVTDTLDSDWTRRVATDSRKYVPIFYSDYFKINDISTDDFQFYFDRPFDGANDLYFAGAKIISDEIFAENGFVYMIDKVVCPLRNAYQIINNGTDNQSFSRFRNLINEFSEFDYNQQKTNEQAGVDLGLQVDSLFDLTFPDLTFDLTNESTNPPVGTYGLPGNVTVRYHHGLVAPTDEAFENFVSEFIQTPGGWGTLEGTPNNIKRIIANTHMSQYEIFPTAFEKGFTNGEADVVTIDESDIIHKEFGSNCSFIGVNKAIVPRAFSSVTGPVYLRRGYSKIMYAIEEAGILPMLKKRNKNYLFFVESDFNTSVDSSLIYSAVTNRFSVILKGGGGVFTEFRLTRASLRNLLLSHIADYQPKGLARKEFIPNLAGTYLIVNNETGEVSGTAPTTEGYQGNTIVPEFPQALSIADNGTTYDIQNWFSFSNTRIYSQISGKFPKFHALLQKAGLSLDKQSRYSFITESDYYTVFVPSEEAIEEANLNALPIDELRQILQLHFVQGDIIFTDGNKTPKYYETMRIDEKSTQYSTVYTKIFIEPGIDKIQIINKNGLVHAEANESETTNILSGILLETTDGSEEEVFPNIVNTAVIHEINKVLNSDEVGN